MSKSLRQAVVIAVLIFSLTTSAAADLIIKSRISGNFNMRIKKNTDSRFYETVTYFKGARQREDRFGAFQIYQCDLKQIIFANNSLKNYFTYSPNTMTPEERAATEAASKQENDRIAREKLRGDQARARGYGGVRTITTTVVDTGERREIFGYTARHIITKTINEVSPSACNQDGFERETDGWYIDLLYGVECSPDLSGAWGSYGEIISAAGEGPYFPLPLGNLKPHRKPRKGCSGTDYDDEIHFKQIGTARFGYPLLLTFKVKQKDTKTSITTREVTDITNTELDPSLFEVPAGFTKLIFKSYGVVKQAK